MAIAFITASNSSGTHGSGTITLGVDTTIGSPTNVILFAALCDNAGGSSITTATYNGVAMNQIGSVFNAPSTRDYYLFYSIVGNGVNANVVFNSSGGSTLWAQTAGFSGSKQTGQPDNTSSVVNPSASLASYSQAVTTIADNCFEFMIGVGNSGNNITAGTNTSIATDGTSDTSRMFTVYSTAAQTPAGSATLAVSSTAQTWSTMTTSFAPSATAAAKGNMFLVF